MWLRYTLLYDYALSEYETESNDAPFIVCQSSGHDIPRARRLQSDLVQIVDHPPTTVHSNRDVLSQFVRAGIHETSGRSQTVRQ